jgi:type II secretory ATPase GspE/PulE/Tfp pilus assembly ATPase PilB-like protein
VKICTIEDPIEYGVGRITQIQVNPKRASNFQQDYEPCRHDPDIIMESEIETRKLRNSIHSLPGHLVFVNPSYQYSGGAILRFLDMGADFLLASTLNVMAQRLVRKICNSCSQIYSDEAVRKKLAKDLNVI